MKALIFLLISFQVHAEGWFCETESSLRTGNVILSCGVGEGMEEAYARKRALDNAIADFIQVCELSADCKGHKQFVESKRTTCKEFNGHFKCYRVIEITLD